MSDLVERIHRRVVEGGGDVGQVDRLVVEQAPLLSVAERAEVARLVTARVVGLGAIDHLLGDPAVSEVMINGPGPVWVEREGAIERAGVSVDGFELDLLIERIVAPIGLRLDPLRPWVDGRLADGSRVSIVGRPVALDGPYLTIRRFAADQPTLADFGSPELVATLTRLVADRSTIVVSGGTGAGKTSLLNALGACLPKATRVITVEDAAELALRLPHVVRLECRPPGLEGDGAVDVRDLVRTALRMRPDRLIVGEVRGAEAFDLMQALNTGHRGSLTTVHANSPTDALRRLAMLVLSADTGVPATVVDEQLAAAIDVVVQVARGAGPRRVVVDLADVVGPGRAVSRGARR